MSVDDVGAIGDKGSSEVDVDVCEKGRKACKRGDKEGRVDEQGEVSDRASTTLGGEGEEWREGRREGWRKLRDVCERVVDVVVAVGVVAVAAKEEFKYVVVKKIVVVTKVVVVVVVVVVRRAREREQVT